MKKESAITEKVFPKDDTLVSRLYYKIAALRDAKNKITPLFNTEKQREKVAKAKYEAYILTNFLNALTSLVNLNKSNRRDPHHQDVKDDINDLTAELYILAKIEGVNPKTKRNSFASELQNIIFNLKDNKSAKNNYLLYKEDTISSRKVTARNFDRVFLSGISNTSVVDTTIFSLYSNLQAALSETKKNIRSLDIARCEAALNTAIYFPPAGVKYWNTVQSNLGFSPSFTISDTHKDLPKKVIASVVKTKVGEIVSHPTSMRYLLKRVKVYINNVLENFNLIAGPIKNNIAFLTHKYLQISTGAAASIQTPTDTPTTNPSGFFKKKSSPAAASNQESPLNNDNTPTRNPKPSH